MSTPVRTRMDDLVDSIMAEPSARSICDELGINDSLRRLRQISDARLAEAREKAVQS